MLFSIDQRAKNITKHAKSSFVFIGLSGIILFPLFYYLFEFVFPQTYENLSLRVFGLMLFFPVLFYNLLPSVIKKYFPWYFIGIATYSLSFFCGFMLIENDFSPTWSMLHFGALLILIIVIYDWLISFLMIAIGSLFAYFLALAVNGEVSFRNFNFEYLPIYIIIMVFSAVVHYRGKSSEMIFISLLKSLGASIAHEMRSPLGSIHQSASLINEQLEKIGKDFPDLAAAPHIQEIKELTDMINRSTIRGNITIDMILKNIHNKKIDRSQFHPVLMSDVIKSVIEEYPFDKGEKDRVFVKYINDFYFKGDENLMVFTLFNLLKNSLYYIKLTNEGRIDIHMENGHNENFVHFQDNGPGISKERLGHIFESFKTYDKKGGTGLGLSFCYRTMNSFDGDIICNSELGEWTEFVMRFPKCDETPMMIKHDEKVVQEDVEKLIIGKTVLLVDDDNLVRMVMKARLKNFDINIIEASYGKQAIDILENQKVDLVFMDIEMPQIDGLATTKKIRSGVAFKSFKNYKDIPIIALTGNSDDEISKIRESGMNAYLEKSMTKEELFVTLFRWLQPKINNT